MRPSAELEEARAAGKVRYFTGEPCKRGHIAERLVSNRNCVVCGTERVVRWQVANLEKKRMWARISSKRVSGTPARKETQRRYRQKYPWKIVASVRARQKYVKRATPPWTNKKDIEAVYEIAACLSEDNIKYSVDHIVPLRGKDVCGLHVPWNLMVMPLDLNVLKGRGSVSDLATRYSHPALLGEPG